MMSRRQLYVQYQVVNKRDAIWEAWQIDVPISDVAACRIQSRQQDQEKLAGDVALRIILTKIRSVI